MQNIYHMLIFPRVFPTGLMPLSQQHCLHHMHIHSAGMNVTKASKEKISAKVEEEKKNINQQLLNSSSTWKYFLILPLSRSYILPVSWC